MTDAEDLDPDFCQDVRNTFKIFCDIAKDEKLCKVAFHLPGVKKVAPMEVVATALLISAFKTRLTMAQLAQAIQMMRKDVRAAEKDIRLNTRAMKQIMSFLKGLKVASLKADPDAPIAATASEKGKSKSNGSSKKAQSSKRKRLVEESSEGM